MFEDNKVSIKVDPDLGSPITNIGEYDLKSLILSVFSNIILSYFLNYFLIIKLDCKLYSLFDQKYSFDFFLSNLIHH